MRTIRFRAWDKYHQKMCMVWEVRFSYNPDDTDCGFEPYAVVITPNTDTIVVNSENVELMQFTGLKDVNGVEIYEGDIVIGKEPYYHTNVKGVVEYGALAFAFVGRAEDGERWCDTITNPNITEADVKVIGNIYENPELLTED